MGDIRWHTIHIMLRKNGSVGRKHEMEGTHTHTHKQTAWLSLQPHCYLLWNEWWRKAVKWLSSVCDDRAGFAGTPKQKKEDGSLEETPEGDKETKLIFHARRYINKIQECLKQNRSIKRRIAWKSMTRQDEIR